MNGSLFSITRYMNGVCFKVSGGTSVPKLPPSYFPETRNRLGTSRVHSQKDHDTFRFCSALIYEQEIRNIRSEN